MRHLIEGSGQQSVAKDASKTLARVFCLPTNAKAEWQAASVDCKQINSASVGISVSFLSVTPGVMRNVGVNGTNEPSMKSRSVAPVRGTHAKAD